MTDTEIENEKYSNSHKVAYQNGVDDVLYSLNEAIKNVYDPEERNRLERIYWEVASQFPSLIEQLFIFEE
jgi:hypothetical protein